MLIDKIAEIFSLAGFSVKKDLTVNHFLVDVLATKDLVAVQKDFQILCICVHEETEQMLRELIFECISANESLKANKILIVADGIEVMGEDRQMAELHNVEIWEFDNIQQFLADLRKDKAEGTKKLMDTFGISSYSDPHVHSGEFNPEPP